MVKEHQNSFPEETGLHQPHVSQCKSLFQAEVGLPVKGIT